MGIEIVQITFISSSLFVLLALPFYPLARTLFYGEQWPTITLVSLVLGCCFQAVLGMLWSHLVSGWPYGEIAVLALVSLVTIWWSRGRVEAEHLPLAEPYQKQHHFVLLLVLVAAFLVRSIHPIESAYLGQSDAYTHLHYLHNIVDQGYLINPTYPPGYHWLLALPVLIFSIDPYLVARFGGVVFGVGLVLAIYVLLEHVFTRRAALFGSICAACFPPMTLLMKTGVGAFANQLGLFLLPVILYFYISTISGGKRSFATGMMLLLSLCGLVAAVTMMLLHVFLLFGAERLLMLFRRPGTWISKTVRVLLIIVPTISLFVYHIGHVGPAQRFQTANIMMGYGDQKLSQMKYEKEKITVDKVYKPRPEIVTLITTSPYFKLIVDYVSIKRKGFGNKTLDGLSIALVILFGVVLVYGFVKIKTGYLVLGLWGLVTSIQASTGFLQFSSYQREGWSLLIAVCCLSGVLADRIFGFGQKYTIFRISVITIILISFSLSILDPPHHPKIRSSAEGDVIRAVRFLGQSVSQRSDLCADSTSTACNMNTLLSDSMPLTIVTRRFTGWTNQGEIAPIVLPRKSSVHVVTVRNRSTGEIFHPENQYIVLVDKKKKLRGLDVVSAFAMVTPSMVNAALKQRNLFYKVNNKLMKSIEGLPESEWVVTQVSLAANLDAFVVIPSQIGEH